MEKEKENLCLNLIDLAGSERISEYDPNKDGVTEFLDLDTPKYANKIHPGISTKQKTNALQSLARNGSNIIGVNLPKK